MTIDELNNITKLTDKRKIERALRAAGHFDCAKHEQLRHLSLLKLAYAEMEDGADYLTANGKWLFNGRIIADVDTAERYEFAIVNIFKTSSNPNGRAIQTEILIWAREKDIKTTP